MLSNKIISGGVIVVIILAVVYIGNQVIRTTPQSGALGQTEYKVVSPSPNSEEVKTLNLDSLEAYVEYQLNKYAKDGWTLDQVYVGYSGANLLILKKN